MTPPQVRVNPEEAALPDLSGQVGGGGGGQCSPCPPAAKGGMGGSKDTSPRAAQNAARPQHTGL